MKRMSWEWDPAFEPLHIPFLSGRDANASDCRSATTDAEVWDMHQRPTGVGRSVGGNSRSDHDGDVGDAGETEDTAVALNFIGGTEGFLEIVG